MTVDQSPVLRDALRWIQPIVGIVLILLGAAVTVHLSVLLIRRAFAAHAGRWMDEGRWRTLQPLVENTIRFVVYFTAFVVILRRLNIDVTAILASASVVGVAVGLGAQHMIRDIIAGIFLISEGLVHVGDVITFEAHTGTVEHIGIRTIQIRTSASEVWTIPNGRLEIFGNKGPRPTPP